MMNDFFEHREEEDSISYLTERFENMLREGGRYFFDIEEYEDLIDHYLALGDLKKCGLAISHSMEQYPGYTGFQIRQAQLLVSSNKAEKALRVLSQVEDIDPTNSEIYITKGAIYSQLKRYDDAIREYNKAITDDEEDLGNIYSNIAYEYENLGNYDKAIEYLKKVLEIEPDNEAIIFELAFCYEITGQNEESVDYFTAYLDRYPYSKFAWFNLGVAFNTLELFEKAIESFEFAIAIDPSFSSAHFNKANSLAGMQLYRQAIEAYHDTFEHEPPEGLTYYYIGECYEKLEAYDEAIANFRKAVEMDENIADAWIGMGVCYEEKGNLKAALRYIHRGLEMDPDNAEYLATLAVTQQHAGFYNEAAVSFTKSAQINPSDPGIWLDFSAMFAELDEYDHALDVLETGLTHQPDNVALFYRKVAYLYNMGKPKQAMSALHTALSKGNDGLDELFEFAPYLKDDPSVVEIIASYRLL